MHINSNNMINRDNDSIELEKIVEEITELGNDCK